jgi:hypothetical protein
LDARVRDAALAFLSSLSGGQVAAAHHDPDDPLRRVWQYTPGPRHGLALEDMDDAQRSAALALLDSALSASGAATAHGVIALEWVLRALEEEAGRPGAERRNPGHYWFNVYGDPAGTEPWGWQAGGHHLCVHVTCLGDAVASTPLFLGANPARVPHGPREGERLLGAEEELARSFLVGLPGELRERAVVADQAPSDILTGNADRADLAAVPAGIAWSDLDPARRGELEDLLEVYLGRFRVRPAVEPTELTFSWAGSAEPGEGHYYALRAGSFLVEYDNTQNDANHVHTVVRDARRDWGDDLLVRHYRDAHRQL